MRIFAVDYGDARTGLAICDQSELLASPYGLVKEYTFERTLEKTAEALLESKAQLAVVGNPLNMDGTSGPRSDICRQFAAELEAKTGIKTVLWDERRSTVTAAQYLNETNTRGKKRKNVIDVVAATIILESYLAYRKNHPEESNG